jgi:hypothetical protein
MAGASSCVSTRVAAAISLLLLGCTAPEQPLRLTPGPTDEAGELEFVIVPTQAEDARPPIEAEPPTPDPAPTGRGQMWRVMEDADAWVAALTALDPCTSGLPRFPAVSADGSTLALALASSPVADEQAAVIRLYRSEDGTLLANHTLLGPAESQRLGEQPQLARRRYCRRAAELERTLASGRYQPMPVVGGWHNPIRDGLPVDAKPWSRVVSDGATLEVDMAVADIVIARADVDDPALQVRVNKAQRCQTERGQFSTVWSAAGIRVLRRGPCGC